MSRYSSLKDKDKEKYGTDEESIELVDDDTEKLVKNEEEDANSDSPEPAGFFDLFRYATCLDRIFILIGSLFAICQGLGWPAIFLIFGGMTDSFTAPAINENDSSTYNATQAYMMKFEADMNRFTLFYVYVAIAIFVACYFQISFWGMVGERVVHRMRERFFASIMRQDASWFDKHSSGEMTTRLADDFNKVKDGVGDKFSLVLQSLATFIGGFVIGFTISWRLTLVMLAMTPLLALCGALMSKAISGYTTKEQEKYAVAGSVAEEVLSCIRTVVSFRGQLKEVARYDQKLEETLSLGTKKALVIAISFGLNMFIIHATYCLAYWYGSTLVVSGILTAGEVFTVFLCVILGAVTLGNVGTNFAAVAAAKGSAGSVLQIIDREPPIDSGREDGDQLDIIKGTVEFIDVYFRYPTRPDIQILDNLNLRVTPGQTVALVGASGCGKSTTVSLVQRFYDPTEGQVLIDGNDIKSLNVKWLREQIGVVSQEPVLFDCSIAENIRYGRLDATQAEIEEAAVAANAHDFISKLPDGYETVVGERGAQMSGGQKQRIAIARALIRDPKILLLDEATSALDSESEGIVQAALDKASEGRTTIIVAHRLSTIKNVDVIYVFKEGAIVEKGTHSDLMEIKNGIYRELVELQKLSAAEEEKALAEDVIYDEVAATDADVTPEASHRIRRRSTRTSFGEYDRVKAEEQEKIGEDLAFRQIFAMNKPELGYIIGGCLASVVVGASMPAFAVFFSELVRVFAEPLEKLAPDAVFWSLMFLVLGAAVGLGNFFMQFFLGVSGEKLTKRLRSKTFESILRQEIGWFDEKSNSTGALTTRLATDASMVRQATGIRVGTVVQSVSGIVTGLVIALVFGWKLALAILAVTPLCAVSGAIQNKVQHGGQKRDNELLAMAGKVASEAIENVRTVQSLTREEQFYDSYCDMLIQPFKEALKTCHVYGLSFAFSQSIIFFIYAGAFRFGAYLVYTGDMSPPNVFRVFFAIAFAGIAMGQAASLLPDYSKAKLSAAHILKIMNTIPSIDCYSLMGAEPDDVQGKIEFQDVKFAYPNRPDIDILKGLNLTVKPGQSVALVGSSGSGKSTTVSLIQRFYDPNRGQILLDGTDLTKLNVTWLRKQIGVVSQEPVLFDCSIRDNISYGVDYISDYDIIDAARIANIHDFIEDLPAGYDTQVGEKGTQLSGGQKQRIAIARALVCSPKILLLDEATSALDTESEKIVQVALDKARAGRTCLIIAHRLSTIQNADSIAVVENGVIAEQGTHQELLAKQGSYYNLCNAQRLA